MWAQLSFILSQITRKNGPVFWPTLYYKLIKMVQLLAHHVLKAHSYTDTRTCLYAVVNAGPSSSIIGGREGTSLTGSGSARSLPSSPNHFMH